ncbi:MAG: hypothetical protein GX434_11025 [Peptococcaceae bacterium]|nr:hypothetical protein [Peptococcaceae bacterium]
MWVYVIWGILLIVIIAMLVRMRTLFSVYVCPRCGSEFTLKPIQEFFFPQIMYRKIARCPKCRKIVRAGIMRNQANIDKLDQTEKNHSKNGRGKKKTKNFK